MSGSSAPSVPSGYYSYLFGQASSNAATDTTTSADQLAWAKNLWTTQQPMSASYQQNQLVASAQQQDAAATAQQRLESIYYPIENQFATEASTYNSPARAAQNAGAAEADVATQYAGQRASSLQSLESYGIDPSQTRYGALDLGTRISQAAATAAAGTQSRLNTENTGLALQQAAINVGRTYPSQISSEYAGSANSGSSGINAQLNTASTYGNLMGTPTQWSSLANSSLNTGLNTVNSYYQNSLAEYNANTSASNSLWGGIGKLVGGLGTAALLKYSDARLKTDVEKLGETEMGIPIVSYRFKGSPKNVREIGVIAQDVEKVIPEAVFRNNQGIRVVDYAQVR